MSKNTSFPFKRNSHIVHFVMGVCLVVDIGPLQGYAKEQVFYHLQPVDVAGPIKSYISVGKEMNVLRPLSSPKTLARAIEVMKGEPKKAAVIASRRISEATQKLNCGDIITLAEVIRDFSPRGHIQPYSYRTIFEAASTKFIFEYARVYKYSTSSALKDVQDQTSNTLDLVCADNMIIISQKSSANPHPM